MRNQVGGRVVTFRPQVPRPRLYQTPVLLSPSRRKIVLCGRRWGKSTIGVFAVMCGHGPAGSPFRGVIDGGRVMWVARTSGVAADFWRSIKRVCAPMIDAGMADKSERERRIALPGGGVITVKSAMDPDSLRGPGLDGLVIDEAAFIRPEAYEVLRPTLSDLSGWLIMLTSPPGVRNWFTELWERAERRPEWARWQRASSENSQITAEELAEAREDLGPRLFAREYLADITAGGVAFWKWEHFRRHWADASLYPYRVLAVDSSWGTSIASDYSAIAVWGTDGVDYAVLDAWRGIVESPELPGHIRRLAAMWDPAVILVEKSSAGIYAYQELMRTTGLPLELVPVSKSKQARVEMVTGIAEAKKILVPSEDGGWRDEWMSEHVRFPGPYDDWVDTTTLALARLKQPKAPPRVAIGVTRDDDFGPFRRPSRDTDPGPYPWPGPEPDAGLSAPARSGQRSRAMERAEARR